MFETIKMKLKFLETLGPCLEYLDGDERGGDSEEGLKEYL